MWDFWKQFQSIAHTQEPGYRHKNQISSYPRTRVIRSGQKLFRLASERGRRTSILLGESRNFGPRIARDLIFVSIPRFIGMRNWLELFPEVSRLHQKKWVSSQKVCRYANLHNFRLDNHFTWGRCETSGNSFNQLPIPKNLGIDTKIKSLALLEPKLRDWDSLDYFTYHLLLVTFKSWTRLVVGSRWNNPNYPGLITLVLG